MPDARRGSTIEDNWRLYSKAKARFLYCTRCKKRWRLARQWPSRCSYCGASGSNIIWWSRSIAKAADEESFYELAGAWKQFAERHRLPPISLGGSKKQVLGALKDVSTKSSIHRYLVDARPEDAVGMFEEWTRAVLGERGAGSRKLTPEEKQELDKWAERFMGRSPNHAEIWQGKGMF
jgi:hypothetical protein